MDNVIPMRDTKAEVIAALEVALELAQGSQPFGVIVVMAGDGVIETLFSESLRAESVIAMLEVVKAGAVDALREEVTS